MIMLPRSRIGALCILAFTGTFFVMDHHYKTGTTRASSIPTTSWSPPRDMAGAADRRQVVLQFDLDDDCGAKPRPNVSDCVVANNNAMTTNLTHTEQRVQSENCLMKLWRATEEACATPLLATPPTDDGPRHLHCSCADKRVATAHAVTVLAVLTKYSSIDAMIAVTTKVPTGYQTVLTDQENSKNYDQEVRLAPQQQGKQVRQRTHLYYLIDASSSQFVVVACWKGQTKVLNQLTTKFGLMISQLERHHNEETRCGSIKVERMKDVVSNKWASSSCAALQKHPRAMRTNHSSHLPGEVDRTTVPPAEVYYAFDQFSRIAGHALESLLNGVAQYVTEGFHKRNIPWLVPCVNEEIGGGVAAHPLVWTQFFLELNDGPLQFPFYPVDLHKHFDVDSSAFLPLVFPAVHFATPSMGTNTLCLRSVLQSLLWPHAVQQATSHCWDSLALKKMEGFVSLVPTTLSQTDGIMGHMSRNTSSFREKEAPIRRIAFLKMLKRRNKRQEAFPASADNSPERGYPYSLRFERLLLERGILPLSPTLPLFERMWHVNNAELIVTTWGSTLTCVMNLLFERRPMTAPNNTIDTFSHLHGNESGESRAVSPPPSAGSLRILVLIHQSYCHEATVIFRKPLQYLCSQRRLPTSLAKPLLSKVVRHQMSRKAGAVADYYHGGNDFCVKYVFVHSLSFVGSRELDFIC